MSNASEPGEPLAAHGMAPGLAGVVIGETRLSRVDGEAGELIIGGFPLEGLAPRASFEETLHLLWFDRLPDARTLESLRAELARSRSLPPIVLELLGQAAAAGADPMAALRMGVSTLDLAAPRAETGDPVADARAIALGLVAALPSVAAAYHRIARGLAPVAPDPALGHAANYLWMLSDERPDPARVRAMDTYLNTAVDHGMNASTFTARVIASTRSDVTSAVVGALGALKGPLHGGAPGPALDMVFELRDEAARTGSDLAALTRARVLREVEAGARIMGFGHRIYRVRDPRADVLGAAAEALLSGAGDTETSLYRDALVVEAATLRALEEAKPERRLATNVEFYTALLLHGIGLPTSDFSPTFAVARVGGWTAHVLEQIAEDRLIRPRVAYAGPDDRSWEPLAERATTERVAH